MSASALSAILSLAFLGFFCFLLGNHFGYRSGLKFAKTVVEDQLKVLQEFGNCLERNKNQVHCPNKGGNDDQPS